MATPRTRADRQSPGSTARADTEHQPERESLASQRASMHAEPTPAAVAAEAAAIYPAGTTTGPTPAEIAAEAYAMYMARGSEHGKDLDDWLEAERALRQRQMSDRYERDEA
jgi:Protein of unknown function (DUF2934)